MGLVGAAADVEEIGRLAAVVLDDVHGAHGQPGPVHQAADGPRQADVAEAGAGRAQLGWIFFGFVPIFFDFGMAEQGVVVECHLGVQGRHFALWSHHDRIDLCQAAILVEENADERGHEGFGLGDLVRWKGEIVG